MNLNLKGLLAIAAVLCTVNVKAQDNDYVITAIGRDTIHCKVSSHKFKINGGRSIKLMPEVIREYHIAKDDKNYMAVYREKKKKPEFFVVLERGKIVLLEGETTSTYGGGPGSIFTSSSSTQWYIAKGSDTVKEVKNNEIALFGKSHKARKNDFEAMISDNTDVFNKYKSEDKFSFKQVRNLVHLYNTGEPFKEQ